MDAKFFEALKNEDLLIHPATLLSGIVLIAGLIAVGDGLVKDLVTTGFKRRLLMYLIIMGVWIGVWFYKRYVLPRNPKSKIGIILAITTENNKEKIRLTRDLAARLKSLISANQLDDLVNVLVLKNHQAERIIPVISTYTNKTSVARQQQNRIEVEPKLFNAWNRIKLRIRGHFYIYGTIKERQEIENQYFLETNGFVVHPPLDFPVRQKLSQDINSIWSHRFSFPEKAEYAGFIFSANYLFLAAKYIIGCAAFGVGLAETALQLHENLGSELKTIEGHPNIAYITKRLNSLLAEEHAIVAYHDYASGGDQEKAKAHLVRCFDYDPKNYDGHLLKAIIEFLYQHNPTQALQTINAAASFSGRNGTWRYSKGFLLMYLERFERALAVYHDIVRNSFAGEDSILSQVYDFNANLLQREPDKIQSYFILGFLKYKKEQNYPEALGYFQAFLEKGAANEEFRSLLSVAESYKTQLERIMQLD